MATDDTKILSFERGLNREYPSEVVPGTARSISNWQPQPDGGLLTRRKWLPGVASPNLSQEVQSLAVLPELAGWRVPIRRQRIKRQGKGLDVTDFRLSWREPTLGTSLLVAIVSYAHDSVGTSTITVTPPVDWVPVATVHSNDAPTTVSIRSYMIPNAAEREGEEAFTFAPGVRRVQVELTEWRGVDTVDPLDVIQVGSAHNVRSDTGFSAATDPAFPTQLVIGATAMVTKGKDVEPSQEEYPEGWFPHKDISSPHISAGTQEYWLSHAVARKVIFESNPQRFYAIWESLEDEEDDIKGRNVAMLMSFKAKRRAITDQNWLVAARKVDAGTHGIEVIDVDDVATGAWTDVGTILGTDNQVGVERPLSMAVGPDGVVFSATDLKSPGVVSGQKKGLFHWDGEDLLRINNAPRGNAVHWHPRHHRFYTGGTFDYPNRLHWSEVGDMTTWLEDSWVEIGTNGEHLLDIATVNEGLLVAKRGDLYVVLGQTEPEGVYPLAGGQGMPGRCICPFPGGAIIVSQNHIWRWTGGAPELISRALDDWWATVPHPFVHTAYVNGLVYISGARDNSLLVYDTQVDIWWVDTPPEPFQVVYASDGHRLYGGVDSNAAGRSVYFKEIPGTVRAIDDGGESFHARTQEMMLGTPARPSTPKWLWVSYRKSNYQPEHNPVVVTPIYDGIPQTPREITEVHPVSNQVLGNGSFRIRLDVGVKARSAAHRVAYVFDYDAVNETCFDIEAMELVCDVEERR